MENAIEVSSSLLVRTLDLELRKEIDQIFNEYSIPEEVAPEDAEFVWITVKGEKAYGMVYSICGDIFHIHSEFRFGKRAGFFEIALPVVDKIAKENGCSRVVFHTVRPGMIKEGIKRDFKILDVRLEREIP